jgi:hypothetical protein
VCSAVHDEGDDSYLRIEGDIMLGMQGGLFGPGHTSINPIICAEVTCFVAAIGRSA